MRFTFCSGFFVPIRAHFFDPGLALFFIELGYVFLSCASSFFAQSDDVLFGPDFGTGFRAKEFQKNAPPQVPRGCNLLFAGLPRQITPHHIAQLQRTNGDVP